VRLFIIVRGPLINFTGQMTYFYSQKGDYMKIPKERKTYCPNCKKHTIHTVLESKRRKASELKWGQRQFRRVTSGYRGYPRPLPSGNKPTKKLDLRYKCKECNKSHIKRSTFRAGKVEFIQK
jgi:large subunit ribosomal protein L44e